MIKWDGLNDAVIGKSTDGQLVYDVDKIIDIFMNRDGMNQDDAIDFFWHNVEGSRHGKDFPVHVFIEEFGDMEIEGEDDT